MPDQIVPAQAPACPQEPTEYMITSEGVGYGESKQAALDAARAQADKKIELKPVCPPGCNEERKTDEPAYDSTVPQYTAYGKGWKCTLDRKQKTSLACKQTEQP